MEFFGSSAFSSLHRGPYPFPQGCLSSGEAGDRDTEREGDVVETGTVEELHRIGISTVLTADTNLELGLCGTSAFDTHLNKLANTSLVKAGKRIVVEDLLV